jgi:hypothetical protein
MTELNVKVAPLTREEIKAFFKDTPLIVSREELEVVLQNCKKGARPITIVATTTPKLNVKDKDGKPMPPEYRSGAGKNAVWHVRKRSVVNGFVQFDYENAVNRQREREGLEKDFAAVAPTWGEARDVEGKNYTCLQDWTPKTGDNAGKPTVYLYLKVERSLGYEYFLKREGAWDGVPLEPADVNAFLPDRGDSRQGVEDEIIVRKYTLANVERIVIDGLTFIVKGTAAYEEWAHPVAA